MSRRTRSRSRVSLAALGLLGGCAVGPNYEGPPKITPLAEARSAFHRADAAQAVPTPPLAPWWTALADPELDRLETLALRNSPTLAEAEARLRKARATIGQYRASLLPSGGVTGNALRVDLPSTPATNSGSGATAGAGSTGGGAPADLPSFTFYNVGLDAVWQIDLFGGTRRQIESARADAEYQQIELEDSQVTLTADVAKAYVNLRDAQNRQLLAKAKIDVQLRMLALTRARRARGTANDSDVEKIIYQLNQSQADALPLAGEVEIYTDQLSQLTGGEPGTLDAELTAPARLPLPPAKTEIGDPASFLRRRPDIRAAERKMASQNALIGYNISQFFPSVSLLGIVGSATTKASQLLTGDSVAYIGGPVISWNFLNLPSIRAKVRGARADYDQAVATYRAKVLSALLDAENGLSRFGHQRDNVGSLAEALASAGRSSAIAQTRYVGGTVSLVDRLDTERQRIEAESSLAQGQAQLTNDWIALQSSLGLGWGSPAPRERRGELVPADAPTGTP